MSLSARRVLALGLVTIAAGTGMALAGGQQPAATDHAAAIKANMAASQAALRHYEWVETTVVSLDGEEKARTQNRVYYGADGAQQKVVLSAPAEQEQPRGLRGKAVAKKKAEMTTTMQQAVALVHQYLPPDAARIEAVKTANGMSAVPGSDGTVTLTFANYLKAGDSLAIQMNMATNAILGVHVTSYLETPDDAVTLQATMGTLADQTTYTVSTVLELPQEKLRVAIDNTGYRKTS